jgi:hypothetical protein
VHVHAGAQVIVDAVAGGRYKPARSTTAWGAAHRLGDTGVALHNQRV